MEQRDFFISYTKTDESWAVWIADALKRNGYSAYCQALDIGPGDNFLEKMEEFIENSANFIAVWSKAYSQSRFCMTEFRAAFHEWEKERMACLLPVRVDNHSMKALYAPLVHVKLSDRGAASEKTLIDAVHRAVPRPNTPTDTATNTPTNTPEPEEDAETLFYRGCDYCFGENGVKQDYTKARYYWKQAADKGNATALFNLGRLYYDGFDVTKDYAEARYYWEQAADKGDAKALWNLALLYEDGKGVKKDYAKALEYYQKAADAGDEDAEAKVDKLWDTLYG